MVPGVLLMGRSCTFGFSPLSPRRFNEVQANSLYQRERMLGSSWSPSCRKQSIGMIFVTRGHRGSQAGDTTAAGDTEDLPRAPRAGGECGDAAGPAPDPCLSSIVPCAERTQGVQPCPRGVAAG